MLLHDEGRRGDIGKEHAHGEAHLQHIVEIPPVAQHRPEGGQQPLHAAPLAAVGRQRLLEMQVAQQQQKADSQEHHEDTLPPDRVGKKASQYRRSDRCHPVDGPDDGHRLGQILTRKEVGSDRTRHHNTASSGHTLYQTEEDEALDRGRHQTAHRRHDKERHGGQQRRATAVAVAQRTEKELTQRQPDHARREAQLNHRSLCVEIAHHRRQTGQIHVGHKRTESRQCPQQYK